MNIIQIGCNDCNDHVYNFIKENQGGTVTIQVEAGESQITNYDTEVTPSVELQPGVLSEKRGQSMVQYLTQFFNSLVTSKGIDKMPEIPQPITKIGTTPYKKGDLIDPNTKKIDPEKYKKYEPEQFVRAIVSVKKDYECIVGMEIVVGYFNGKNKSTHTCDEAIFELRMNGVSIGEVNLNNSVLDTTIDKIKNYNAKVEKNYTNAVDRANKRWENLVQSGIEKDSPKAKEKYMKDMVGDRPEQMEIPEWMTDKAKLAGYQDVNQFMQDITKINDAFKSYGRKSDNVNSGSRSQSFILDGAKAKSIIDNAPSDKIVLSIVPLVSKDGKYKIFYSKGSHADTPWVTIKGRKSEQPLFDGEPNVGMKRGSTEETVLLTTDLCGNPLTK